MDPIAIVFFIIAVVLVWGGLAFFLTLLLKSNKREAAGEDFTATGAWSRGDRPVHD